MGWGAERLQAGGGSVQPRHRGGGDVSILGGTWRRARDKDGSAWRVAATQLDRHRAGAWSSGAWPWGHAAAGADARGCCKIGSVATCALRPHGVLRVRGAIGRSLSIAMHSYIECIFISNIGWQPHQVAKATHRHHGMSLCVRQSFSLGQHWTSMIVVAIAQARTPAKGSL